MYKLPKDVEQELQKIFNKYPDQIVSILCFCKAGEHPQGSLAGVSSWSRDVGHSINQLVRYLFENREVAKLIINMMEADGLDPGFTIRENE